MKIKNINKKTAVALCISAFALTTTSCDKLDCNGELDGMWQMTKWENKYNGYVYATKNDNIYYHVKLATFHYTKDSLYIDEVYSQPFDSICPYDSLKAFGVTDEGRFKINSLDNSYMELENNLYILKFRKY